MTHGPGKSDSPTVPGKSPNKAGPSAAEGMEGNGLAKGNLLQQNASRTPSRKDAPSELERVRQAAKQDKQLRFTALLHHIYNRETLRRAYFSLKKEAAPGVDGETWRHYGEDLERNLQDLSERLKRGAYRAKPVRRVYIPEADGRQRPLGVTALEDKIAQRAAVEVLNAIYETDFLGFSYGFRPGRNQHQALDALYTGLLTRKVNGVLDLDIKGFFDGLSHEWLVKFVEHRIADRRVVRLIQKWLNAGVLEDGKRIRVGEGTPRAEVLRRCWLTSTCTTCSTCGYKRGVESERMARSSWCVSRTISCLAFRSRWMPISFGRNSRRECCSSTWNCIPRRRGLWSSVRTRSRTGSGVEKGSRRRSISWALRTSA